jgi:hypothetical protein
MSNALPEDSETLFGNLEPYGIFLVPVGELERWLAESKLPQGLDRKQDWLTAVFETMGNDHTHPAYFRPRQRDVWSFMEKIGRWLADPNRRGMPA